MSHDEIVFIDAYFIASFLIVVTGMLDDMSELLAKPKALVQLIAALIMVWYGKCMIDKIYLPFLPVIDLGGWQKSDNYMDCWDYELWINLIDGLDGLSFWNFFDFIWNNGHFSRLSEKAFVAMLCCLLLGSTEGYLDP